MVLQYSLTYITYPGTPVHAMPSCGLSMPPACLRPPKNNPHNTANKALIDAHSQGVPPCPHLGHTDPFLVTLLALKTQAGQLQPSAAGRCHGILGTQAGFCSPRHALSCLCPCLCPCSQRSPGLAARSEERRPRAHPCDLQPLPEAPLITHICHEQSPDTHPVALNPHGCAEGRHKPAALCGGSVQA